MHLIRRHDTKVYEHVNIETLFEYFNILPRESFVDMCFSVFTKNSSSFDHSSPIDGLAEAIKDLKKNKKTTSTSFENAIKLLLYLWNVNGVDNNYPARIALKSLEEHHPIIVKKIQNKFLTDVDEKGYASPENIYD